MNRWNAPSPRSNCVMDPDRYRGRMILVFLHRKQDRALHRHIAHNLRCALKVVTGTRCHFSKDNFLCRSTAQESAYLIQKFLAAGRVGIFLRQEPCDAKCRSARNDGNLMELIRQFAKMADNRMAKLVIRRDLLFFVGKFPTAAFRTKRDFLHGIHELSLANHFLSAPCGKNRSLVHHIFQIRSRKPDCLLCNNIQIHFGHLLVAGMNLQDFLARLQLPLVDEDAPIEPTGTKQRDIEHIGSVCRRHHNHIRLWIKAVHLGEDLVQRLFALVVPAAETCPTALAADCIDFVDEDDAGGITLCAVKKIADAAGADADEHLHKLRSRDAEERHFRLSRDPPRKKSFSGARCADEENTTRNFSSDSRVLFGEFEKINDFDQFFLGLITTGYIIKIRLHSFRICNASSGFAESKSRILRAGDIPKQPKEPSENEDKEENIRENRKEQILRLGILHSDGGVVLRVVPSEFCQRFRSFIGGDERSIFLRNEHLAVLH